jgi:hypothetical protein
VGVLAPCVSVSVAFSMLRSSIHHASNEQRLEVRVVLFKPEL